MMAISNFAEWFVSNPTTANETAPEADTNDQAQDFAALLATSYFAPPTQTTPVDLPTAAVEMIPETITLNVEPRSFATRFELPANLMTPMVPSSNSPTDITISSSPTIELMNPQTPYEIAAQHETATSFSASPKNIDLSKGAQAIVQSLPKNEGLNVETQFNPAPQREAAAFVIPVEAPVLSESEIVRDVVTRDSAPANTAPAQSRSNDSARSVAASISIAAPENVPEMNAETREFKIITPQATSEVIENRIIEIRHDSSTKQASPSQLQAVNDVREDIIPIETKSDIAPSTTAKMHVDNTPRVAANQVVSSELPSNSARAETSTPRESQPDITPASTANVKATNSEPRFTETSSPVLFEIVSETLPETVTKPVIATHPSQVSIANPPEAIASKQPANILPSEQDRFANAFTELTTASTGKAERNRDDFPMPLVVEFPSKSDPRNEPNIERQSTTIPPSAERFIATSPLLKPMNIAASQISSEVIKTAAMIVKAIVTEPRQAQVAEAIPEAKTIAATDAPSTDTVGATSNVNPIVMSETATITAAETTEEIKVIDAPATPQSRVKNTAEFVAALPVINVMSRTTAMAAIDNQSGNDFALEIESETIPAPLRTIADSSSSSLPTTPTMPMTPMRKAVSNVPDQIVNHVNDEVAVRAQAAATPEAQVVTTIGAVANALELSAQPLQMQPAVTFEFADHEALTIENAEAVNAAQTLPLNVSNSMLAISESASKTISSPIVAQTIPPVIEMAKTIRPNETKTLRLSLNPAELGRVEVEITRAEDGRVSASLMAEQTETAQTLTHNISHLRESLERAGVSVEQLNVTTSSQLAQPTTQQFGQSSGQQAEQQQHSSNHFTGGDSLPADQVTDSTAPTVDNKLLSIHA